MKQVLLAIALVAGAVVAFAAGRAFLLPGKDQSLGDLSAMAAIVSDVSDLVGTGDLAGAKTRIADLEAAWDDAEAQMRPKDPEAWGRVDDAVDAALSALRSGTPDAGTATKALAGVQTVMASPTAGPASAGGPILVEGILVTDATGHPLPCEQMLTGVKDRQVAGFVTTDPAVLANLIARATERCNADDDRNANAFSAAALKLLGQG
jgi:hypothetical protein